MAQLLAFLGSLSIPCALLVASVLAHRKATHAVRRVIRPRLNKELHWQCPKSAPRSSFDLDMALYLAAYAAGSMACVVSIASTLFAN